MCFSRSTYYTIISLVFLLVGCYNTADKPLINPSLSRPNTTVAMLRSEIMGTRGATIRDDVVVRGRVVSSDEEDNFYKSIVVEDATGAVEVKTGLSTQAAIYPEGVELTLLLQGCYANYYRGVLQVGVEVEEYDYMSVEYIGSREGVDLVVQRGVSVEPLSPRRMRICDLQKDMCGCLVRVEALTLVAASSVDTLMDMTLDDAQWRGYLMFKDAAGDSIAVRTRDYARFAKHAVPRDVAALTGLLEWGSYDGGKECYHIVMRYESDCESY